jgi:hypothetical protein
VKRVRDAADATDGSRAGRAEIMLTGRLQHSQIAM